MSEGRENVHLDQQKKILFFDSFSFIYRCPSYFIDSIAQSFVEIFVKLIKIKDPFPVVNPKELVDSTINCLLHAPNRFLFINENAALNFYYYFNIAQSGLSTKFWKLCQKIYDKFLDNNSIYHEKLQENVNQLMACSSTSEDCASLLFIFFRMMYRFRLLDEIDFNVDQFLDITESILLRNIHKQHDQYPEYLFYLPKIWTGILQGSRNLIQIDTIDRLILFAALFSIDVSNKFKKIVTSGQLEVTENQKQKLYTIYLSLVAYPIINDDEKALLRKLLKELHYFLKIYLEKQLISVLSIDNQFLNLQFYIKCLVILDEPVSNMDDLVLIFFLGRLATYPYFSNRC
ncbi:hypothetical protein RF11_12616 [Thelohanellus kitauei]|uniref:Uncharacterized protein n=1 Tax=Thelohanellus kitauei TaxID=669202 RepID=A0A0C2MJH9_THEKT|nr:hypothetical protein RF11_12616 [Thelohanellus kitauei]